MTEYQLDADLAVILPLFQGKVAWADIPLSSLRRSLVRNMAAFDMPAPELAEVSNVIVDNVPVRIYRSQADAVLPVMIYLHGGGWVTFNLDSHDSFCRMLAQQGQCVVVSVDYRLAPEHKFPAAIDDVLVVLNWLQNHAADIGGDASRIGIGGDSAGGNLATVVCMLTQGQAIQPVLQCLIYPVVDVTQETESFRQLSQGYMLERQNMEFFINHYLNTEAEKADVRVSPLLQSDKGQLPPALVFTAGFDPLRDEGAAYADALVAAGVAVHYQCFGSLIHGFLQLGKIPAAEQAMREIAEQVKQAWQRR